MAEPKMPKGAHTRLYCPLPAPVRRTGTFTPTMAAAYGEVPCLKVPGPSHPPVGATQAKRLVEPHQPVATPAHAVRLQKQNAGA